MEKFDKAKKEKLISDLREKVRNLKNYSGHRLNTHQKHIEKIIEVERLNGNINDEILEELMMAGYVAALKRRADEIIEKRGLDYVMKQTIPNPDYPGQRIIKANSELGKIFNDLSESVKIMLGYKEEKSK